MNANARVTGLWTAAMATAAVILLAVSVAADSQREGAVEERPSFEAATIKPASARGSAQPRDADQPKSLVHPEHDPVVADLHRVR